MIIKGFVNVDNKNFFQLSDNRLRGNSLKSLVVIYIVGSFHLVLDLWTCGIVLMKILLHVTRLTYLRIDSIHF